jgi:hypothetical protein
MTHKFLEELQKRRALRLTQLKEAEKHLKEIEKRLADRDLELAEAKRLLAENEKFEVEQRRRQLEELRRKPGAKWKWKGELGYHLICAVKALTADGTPDAQAFRDLHFWAKSWHSSRRATPRTRERQMNPWTRFERLVGEHRHYLRDECCEQKPRQLAARYCNALKAWSRYFEWNDALDAEMERFRAISAGNDNRAQE